MFWLLFPCCRDVGVFRGWGGTEGGFRVVVRACVRLPVLWNVQIICLALDTWGQRGRRLRCYLYCCTHTHPHGGQRGDLPVDPQHRPVMKCVRVHIKRGE